jgi:hypothetical protein
LWVFNRDRKLSVITLCVFVLFIIQLDELASSAMDAGKENAR